MPLHIMLFYALLLANCGYALVSGGKPERLAAAMLLAATILSKLFAIQVLGHFRGFEVDVFWVDVALLLGLTALALNTDRYWPIWMTSLHAYTVVAHLGELANPGTVFPIYMINSALVSYPIVMMVGIATWRHRARLRLGIIES